MSGPHPQVRELVQRYSRTFFSPTHVIVIDQLLEGYQFDINRMSYFVIFVYFLDFEKNF